MDEHKSQSRTGYLFRKIPERNLLKRFWIGQPVFVERVQKAIDGRAELNNEVIVNAMEETYEVMKNDKALAEASGFWFRTAKNSINRIRRTMQ